MRQSYLVMGGACALALAAMGCGGGKGEPDRTRPLPAEGFSVSATGGDVSGSWTLPDDPDAPAIAGVVVVRLEGLPEAPVDGEEYDEGDLALGGEVVFVGNASSFDDLGLPPGDASYVVFTYTRNRTYGPSAAAATRIALSAQSATLVIDIGAETATVTSAGGTVEIDADLRFTTGAISGSVLLRLTNLTNGNLFNPKLVMTSATDQLAADRTLDIGGATGTMPSADPFFHFGPEALAVGRTSSSRNLTFNNVDASTVLTLEFDVENGPTLVGGEHWTNNTDQILPLFDVGAEAVVGSLRGTPFGPGGYLRPDGGYLSPDGRFLYMGSRNAPEVTVYDLTTLYPVAILPIAGEHGRGSVPYLVPSAGGGTLYALFLDGAHAYRWSNNTEAGLTTGLHVELVRIDRVSLEETGRVRLETRAPESDTGVRGRRMALSPDGRRMAIPVIATRDRRDIDPSATEAFGSVHFVDLGTMTELDTDPGTDGVQPLATGDLPVATGGTGVANLGTVEWVDDALVLAGSAWEDNTAPNDTITVRMGGLVEISAPEGGPFAATIYPAPDTKPVEIYRHASGEVYVGGYDDVTPMTYTDSTQLFNATAHSLDAAPVAIPPARGIFPDTAADHVWVHHLDDYSLVSLVDLTGPTVVTTLDSGSSMYGHWMAVTPF